MIKAKDDDVVVERDEDAVVVVKDVDDFIKFIGTKVCCNEDLILA